MTAQTIEKTLLGLQRTLPEEFRYIKAFRKFSARNGEITLSLTEDPLKVSARVKAPGGHVHFSGTPEKATDWVTQHLERPEMAQVSIQQKEMKSRRQIVLEHQVKSALNGLGFPVECLSENGRRGMQISCTDREIRFRATFKNVKELRAVLRSILW